MDFGHKSRGTRTDGTSEENPCFPPRSTCSCSVWRHGNRASNRRRFVFVCKTNVCTDPFSTCFPKVLVDLFLNRVWLFSRLTQSGTNLHASVCLFKNREVVKTGVSLQVSALCCQTVMFRVQVKMNQSNIWMTFLIVQPCWAYRSQRLSSKQNRCN